MVALDHSSDAGLRSYWHRTEENPVFSSPLVSAWLSPQRQGDRAHGRPRGSSKADAGAEEGKLKEIFASGTAAVISPVGELKFKDKSITVNDGGVGELSQKLYNTLYGIQTGTLSDDMNWTVEV